MMKIDSLPLLEDDIRRFERGRLTKMHFTPALETRYRRETGRDRARVLLTQGLIALLAYDFFIVGDYILAPQHLLRAVIVRFGIVTPLVLLISMRMKRSRNAVLIESTASLLCLLGSVSILYLASGSMSFAVGAQTGLIFVLLVANCLLRVEQPYAIVTSAIILLLDAFALGMDGELAAPQKMFYGGIMAWVAILTLTANHTLSRERRYSYLLQLRGRLQHRLLATANAELLALSSTDRLTGLANRRSYDERLSQLWEAAIRHSEPLSAVMIDVDHFKRLNDAHGHPYGDRVLQRVASLLQEALRGEDDFIARFGGEEFIVLLPNADIEAALKVAERMRVLVQVAGAPALQRESPSSAADLWSTVSCGVATMQPAPADEPLHLIAAADAAMYWAKQGGRNRVCCSPVPVSSELAGVGGRA